MPPESGSKAYGLYSYLCTQKTSNTDNEEDYLSALMPLAVFVGGYAQVTNNNSYMNQHLNLTQELDKAFPLSDKVDHKKVTFHNHFGLTLAADMYTPKNAKGKLPAIAVSGPFGAVKEQASGLYAQSMAERTIFRLTR